MVCLACREFSGEAVCPRCSRTLVGAPDRWLGAGPGTGVIVRSAWVHDGAARRLVHRLKYDGVAAAARVMAAAMAAAAPELDRPLLVPVPRATVRRLRFGVDPALELARALARSTGGIVHDVLRPGLTAAVHAGRSRQARPVPRLTLRRRVGNDVVLVDDVVTTGVTLAEAARLTGARAALTATSVPEMPSS